MTDVDLWTWAETRADPLGGAPEIVGFKVVANDGEIGHVDSATWDAGKGHIVVDTGPWIFGRTLADPGARRARDRRGHGSVQVDLTKDEIKNAPEYHDVGYDAYAEDAAMYYGGLGRGWL